MGPGGPHLPATPRAPLSGLIVDPERAAARRHSERETFELAASGAVRVLEPDHSATRAFAQAAITMGKANLWKARLAIKTLRLDQREAIAEAVEV